MPIPYPKPQRPTHLDQITIYYNRDEFCGWPFNHGFWAFDDKELLISFSRGPCSYQAPYDMGHSVVDALGGVAKPGRVRGAREGTPPPSGWCWCCWGAVGNRA